MGVPTVGAETGLQSRRCAVNGPLGSSWSLDGSIYGSYNGLLAFDLWERDRGGQWVIRPERNPRLGNEQSSGLRRLMRWAWSTWEARRDSLR